jgi:heme oxygenase
MFSEELKKRTAAAHQDLERKMIPHLKKIGSKLDYIRLLDYLFRYYHPLEKQIESYLSPDQRLVHTSRIREDLKQLDQDYSLSGNPDADVPVISSAAGALGVLYVLEGSSLGGQIITKMLSKQLNLDTGKGFSFYNPYADTTGERWKSFRDQLDRSRTDQENEEIILAANETFLSLNRWISDYGSNKN